MKTSALILFFSLISFVSAEVSRAECMNPDLYSAMQEQWSKIPKAKIKKGAWITGLTIVAATSALALKSTVQKQDQPETEAQLQQDAAEGPQSHPNPAAYEMLGGGLAAMGLMFLVPSLHCPSCVAVAHKAQAEKKAALLLLQAEKNDSSQKEFIEFAKAVRSKSRMQVDSTYILALLREGNEQNSFCRVGNDAFSLMVTKDMETLTIENLENIQKGLRKAPEVD